MLARTRLALGPESLLVALLGLYHVALAVGPEQPWGRGLWLAHIGLLILWQPFVETGRRLSVAELALMGAGILLLTLGLNDWLLIFWTAILSALVGGRVLFVRRRRQRIFLLLAFGYLLGALLAWQVPQVVPREMAVDPALSPVFIYALPLLLLSMLVWPRSREEAPPRPGRDGGLRLQPVRLSPAGRAGAGHPGLHAARPQRLWRGSGLHRVHHGRPAVPAGLGPGTPGAAFPASACFFPVTS